MKSVVPATHVSVRNGTHEVAAQVWSGPGPSIVLLHGAGLGAGIFAPFAEDVAGHLQVIAIDLRGHGRSGRPTSEADYALAAQAGDVISVLDHLAVDEAVGFGHSFGGAIVLQVLLSHPGRLSAALVHEPAVGNPFDDPDRALARADKFTERILSRQRAWPTRERLLADISKWPTFREVELAFLRAFVDDGSQVIAGEHRLRCAPAVEALLFRLTLSSLGGNGLHKSLPVLAEAELPLSITFGRDGTIRRPLFEWLAGALDRPLSEIPGAHFAPFASRSTFHDLLARHIAPELRPTPAVGPSALGASEDLA